MKIEQQHIDHVCKQFALLQSKEDILNLLNYVNKLLYGENFKPLQLKSLTYYANPDICKNRYSQFSINKKSGEKRIINAPVEGLKNILKPLNFILQCLYNPHKAAMGFVPNKSIVDNAKKHTGNNYVYNIDLKDFFHSFDRNRVKRDFLYHFFNLDKEREPLAFLLSSLCTHPFEIEGETKIVLPQGSPTSPTITNILCQTLDRRLTGLANRFGLQYTRYADDITFSSQHNIYKNKDFQNELRRIIEKDQNLQINPKKTRLQKRGYKQEVTGLVVNEKINVRRPYVEQIRMWLYYWEKYGYSKAVQIFIKDYKKDKGHIKNGKPNLANVLEGKLLFLKMVKGENNSTYLKLRKRFNKLNANNSYESTLKQKNKIRDIDKTLEKLCETNFDLSVL